MARSHNLRLLRGGRSGAHRRSAPRLQLRPVLTDDELLERIGKRWPQSTDEQRQAMLLVATTPENVLELVINAAIRVRRREIA